MCVGLFPSINTHATFMGLMLSGSVDWYQSVPNINLDSNQSLSHWNT